MQDAALMEKSYTIFIHLSLYKLYRVLGPLL